MKIDPALIREMRTSARMSQRSVADTLGMTSTAIERVETTGDVTDWPAGTLDEFASILGCTVADLAVKPDETPPDGTAARLDQLVGATLHTAADGIRLTTLATLLDTDLHTTADTVTRVAARLRPAGLHVTSNRGLLRLVAHPDAPESTAIVAADAVVARRERVILTDATIVADVLAGNPPPRLPDSDWENPRTGNLINGDMLRRGDDQTPWGVTDDVRFSLDP